MTVAFVATMEVNILNWIKGTPMPTAPTGIKFGLLSAIPDHDESNIHELNGNGYARQTVTFGSVTTDNIGRVSSVLNTNSVIFGPAITADWAQALYGAFFSADDDSMIAYGPLAAARLAPVGDTISFGIGSLQLRSR